MQRSCSYRLGVRPFRTLRQHPLDEVTPRGRVPALHEGISPATMAAAEILSLEGRIGVVAARPHRT